MIEKYDYYASISSSVERAMETIRNLPFAKCYDAGYIEKELVLELGLNDESLHEQPGELAPYFGKGLHLWQYPSQLASYLVWLTHNGREVRNYTEIGCRWGGTFILINEWLKKIGAPLEFSLAIDPIKPTPFIEKYRELSSTPVHYIEDYSTSPKVAEYLRNFKPDMVFIDGDHSLQGVMNDHLLVRKTANIIVDHDVSSQACIATTVFWNYLKQAETDFNAWDFVQQYESVEGSFLGIGALKRK